MSDGVQIFAKTCPRAARRRLERERTLPRTHQSHTADAIALSFAAGIASLFGLLRWPSLNSSRSRLLLAVTITLVFALAAWLTHGVSGSGALAGAGVAFVLAATDPRLFGVLLVVFAVTLAATRVGRAHKEQLRVAESKTGRSASQVMANVGVAALIVAIAPPALRLLALASLAEVAADTSSSETGQAFPGKTVLITNWKPVPSGLDGGISVNGTTAACVAAMVVALTARCLGLASDRQAAIVAACGILGMLVDSVLGAVFERRGYLNNDLVNLFGTASAAGLAWLMM